MTALLATLLIAALSLAQIPDLPEGGGWREFTAAVSDSGRITIADPWAIGSDIKVFIAERQLLPETEFEWIDSSNTIIFLSSSEILPGDSVRVKYRSAAITSNLSFQLYAPYHPENTDTSADTSSPLSSRLSTDPFASWQGLRRSGSITRGVQFGGAGGGEVTSGMHLELSGRPTPGITVDAILDDRNLPATQSGASASLSELDRLLFQAQTKHLSARLGDLDIDWERGFYGSFSRTLKGASAEVRYPMFNSAAAALGGNNRYSQVSFFGRDGDQGPYELRNLAGNPGVVIASGSEIIYLNGVRLKRGRRADYTVDYNRGTITFNPRHAIRSDSRIEVEYQYNDGDYPRYLYAFAAGMPGEEKQGLLVETTFISEGADEDNPIAFEWTDEWLDTLALAGDSSDDAVVSGIDSVGIGAGDYIWATEDNERFLLFSQPDSAGRPTGYLSAQFNRSLNGGYRRIYDGDLQAFYFVWVGGDSGDWAPVRFLPLPEKKNLAAINTAFRGDDFKIAGEIAFSQNDRNVLSDLDDSDNEGFAWRWRGDWSPEDDAPLSLFGSIRREEANFSSISRQNNVDQQYKWDLSDTLEQEETEIEAGAAVRPLEKVRLTASGGYLERTGYEGQRMEFGGLASLNSVGLSGGINKVEGDYSSLEQKTDRLGITGNVRRNSGFIRPAYAIKYEDKENRTPDNLSGYRFIEHLTELMLLPSRAQEVTIGFGYRFDDSHLDEGLQHESDTRTFNGIWNGKGLTWGGWSMDLLRYHQTFTDTIKPDITATSASMETVVSPRESPWRLRLDYELFTGSDRASAQAVSYTHLTLPTN